MGQVGTQKGGRVTVLVTTELLKRTVTTLLDHRFHGKPRGFREQKAGGVSEGKASVPFWFLRGRTFLLVSLSWGEEGLSGFIHSGRVTGKA